MELVYLWVAEYKNIKNQGFNFSPRFTCKYENGELTIEEKKDYVSIFPENINVTAIVGENGAGKSSLLELTIHNIFFDEITITDKPQYFCIYAQKDILYYKQCNMKFKSNISIEKLEKYPILLHYDNSFSKIEFYNPLVNTSRNIFLFPAKEEKFHNHVTNDELKNILLMMNQNLPQNHLYEYFTPNQIYIDLHNSRANDVQDITLYTQYMKQYIFDCYQSFEREASVNIIFNIPKVNDNFSNWENIINKIDQNMLNEKLTQKLIFDEIKRFDYLIKNFDIFMKLFKLENDNILTEIEEKYSSFQSVKKRETISIQKKNFIIDKKALDDTSINILINLPKSIELNIYDSAKNISYKELSNGEKTLLNIRFYLERAMTKNKNKNFIVLIDEAETDLHPQWQKNIINYLISSLKRYHIHFIITSHSPFLLSDLPKENVIFLENGKQVYPNIETFGANIHTLLSHGFFMKDGLMGEFAKNKINEVIDYLNGKKSPIKDDDEAQRYIHIIGEPIVKRQLQRMLDSKRTDKMKEIDALKNQIENLQSRLENLEKKP